MANGDALGGLTPEQYFHANKSPYAVQPPAATGEAPGWLRRYASAAGEGMVGAAPIAAAELAFTGGAAWPGAVGTEAVGALSGIASQAASDLFPGTPWAGPAAGTVVGLGAGGLSAPVRAAGRYAWAHSPWGQAAVIGAGDLLAHSIATGGSTLATLAQHAPEALATATVVPLYRGVRNVLTQPGWGSLRYPAAGFMGGVGQTIAEQTGNQLMPTPGL
jgi:hypothetical protein